MLADDHKTKSLSENLSEYGKMKGKSGRGNNGKNQTVGSE
jgi:hypothetical protein